MLIDQLMARSERGKKDITSLEKVMKSRKNICFQGQGHQKWGDNEDHRWEGHTLRVASILALHWPSESSPSLLYSQCKEKGRSSR